MIFFGNVPGVEIEADEGRVSNESEWKEDLRRLGEICRRAMKSEKNQSKDVRENQIRAVDKSFADSDVNLIGTPSPTTSSRTAQESFLHSSAVKIQLTVEWAQQFLDAGALVACALLWGIALWVKGNRSEGGGLRSDRNSKKT